MLSTVKRPNFKSQPDQWRPHNHYMLNISLQLKIKVFTFFYWYRQEQAKYISEPGADSNCHCNPSHCCLVVYINVIQQQNIFINWMNRPSDDSFRRIFPVQIWKLPHLFKKFLIIFFWSFKNFVICLTMEKRPKNPEENTQAYVRIFSCWSICFF